MYTHICVYTKDIYMVHKSYIYICYIIHTLFIYIYILIISHIYDRPILTGSLFKHPSIFLCVFPFP